MPRRQEPHDYADQTFDPSLHAMNTKGRAGECTTQVVGVIFARAMQTPGDDLLGGASGSPDATEGFRDPTATNLGYTSTMANGSGLPKPG
jgi:hypothetical protein